MILEKEAADSRLLASRSVLELPQAGVADLQHQEEPFCDVLGCPVESVRSILDIELLESGRLYLLGRPPDAAIVDAMGMAFEKGVARRADGLEPI